MPKYYETTAIHIRDFLRKVPYKEVIQINEFLVKCYIPHRDPSMMVIKSNSCLYVMKAHGDHIRGNIYHFTGNVKKLVKTFIGDSCTKIDFDSDDSGSSGSDDEEAHKYSKTTYKTKYNTLLDKYRKIKREDFEGIPVKIIR